MDYFLLFPDYNIISKYSTLPQKLDVLLEHYDSTGYPINLNKIFNGTEFMFKGTHMEGVKHRLDKLLADHSLEEHKENILFIFLYNYQLIGDEDDYLYFNLQRKTQTKQLAQFLLSLKTTPEDQLVSLSLKTVHKSGTAKLTDPAVISWVYKAIQSYLELGLCHPGFMTPFDMELNNVEDLKVHATQVIPKPTRAPIAHYFLTLHDYLINETDFRPTGTTQLTDKMSRFYFELLSILEIINPDAIESEPKDYIRTAFTNHSRRSMP